MMRNLPRSLLSVAATLSLLSGAASFMFGQTQQQPKPNQPAISEQDIEEIFTRRVRLPITITDKKGHLVSGLTQNDFLILEDKVPQKIDSFDTELGNKLPLYIAVLMDTSASTAGKRKFEQESAMNFIQTVVRPRKDRVLFATFDDEVKLHQDFTDKLDLLDRSVSRVKGSGDHTALFDAIWQFCDQKMRSVQGRRAMVVISDGEDTYSRASLADAIDIAQRTETTIFAISTKEGFAGTVPGVEAGQVKDQKDKDLVRLCEETGGAAFFTGDMLALERSFTKISKELRNQYLITYRSTNEVYDGSYRRIDVRLTNGRENLKLRTKRGYKAVRDSVTTPR